MEGRTEGRREASSEGLFSEAVRGDRQSREGGCMPSRCWEAFGDSSLISEPRWEGREELVWGWRVGRDKGTEQREVEKGWRRAA